MSLDQHTLAMFAQVGANHPRLREWLEAERASAVKYLLQASDPVAIHRAQGKAQFIDELLGLLQKSGGYLRERKT